MFPKLGVLPNTGLPPNAGAPPNAGVAPNAGVPPNAGLLNADPKPLWATLPVVGELKAPPLVAGDPKLWNKLSTLKGP